jgi:maltose/maltodextrin transport system permease protein
LQLSTAWSVREVVSQRASISPISFRLPATVDVEGEVEGTVTEGIVLNYTGIREFGPRLHLWDLEMVNGVEQFTNLKSREVIAPDSTTGFFTIIDSPDPARVGIQLTPGFRVVIGLHNYLQILTDKGLQGPFIKIFIWTVVFAIGSVFLSLCVGMFLAVLLEWKELQGRKLYRTLLILPYAVPAFISILIFRGLFNQNFGEINMILNALFGIQPEWFANPMLAKTMILIVNTWLGYPYMMIVCTGILQSVPDTIYEASALDGSNPLTDFFFLTLPLIIKPLFPLLVASFAFNFNNFLIIYLLTGGGPDMVGASTVAGETDILVSYTFRIAFRDSAQNFGYASAIATLIFIIVALIAWYNLRHSVKDER